MTGVYPIACSAINTPLVKDPKPSLPLKRSRVPKAVQIVQEGDWPTSTTNLCWHCCHPFSGPPLPMPFRFDDKMDLFYVTGTFCSWGCVKAYNMDSSSYMRHVNSTIITLFHRRCTGATESVKPAPPRLALKAFGGTMTLEEFRGCERNMMILPPKMIMHRPVVEEIPARLRERPTPQQLQDSVSFKDATTKNDMLRLRRPKPLTSHNQLVRTLGVQILQG